MFFYIFGLKKMISACIYVAAPHICMHFIPHLYRPAVLLRDKLPENRKNSREHPATAVLLRDPGSRIPCLSQTYLLKRYINDTLNM